MFLLPLALRNALLASCIGPAHTDLNYLVLLRPPNQQRAAGPGGHMLKRYVTARANCVLYCMSYCVAALSDLLYRH